MTKLSFYGMAAFLLYGIRGGQKVAQSCELSFDILVSIRNAVLRLSMEVVLPVEWKCVVRGPMRNDR